MPNVFIDGKEYSVPEGINMLEAVLNVGLDLPYFCWHPAMDSVGACRQCAVKLFKDEYDIKGHIVMACMTPAKEGTRISISDPEANRFRELIIEWLMINHPHDCPVCDEGGECHLQDMTALTGHVYRRYTAKKRTFRDQYLGPLINHEMNRCIQCFRCVRFYKDMAGGRDFDSFGSRNRLYFGRAQDGVLESEFSGNLVEICPTGVFTDKSQKKHYTRKWDLRSAPSVCIHCSLGCNTIPGERYGTIRRIRSRYNSDVNEYFLCDRGRYGYEFNNSQIRLKPSAVNEKIATARVLLLGSPRVVGIGSPRASLESNYALMQLVGKDNYSPGLGRRELLTAQSAINIMSEADITVPTLSQIKSADSVLILGADPTNEAPMLDFYIRQGIGKARKDIARELNIPDWDANAVAEAIGTARGTLYISNPWGIKLGEIATSSVLMDYAKVLEFASQVSAGFECDTADSSAEKIACALRDSKQPLVVTSLAAGYEVLQAASEVVRSLKRLGKDCWLFVCAGQANTMGCAALGGLSLEQAVERAEQGDALVVLENDIVRDCGVEALGRMRSAGSKLVVLDSIQSRVSEIADVVVPIASWVESDGTFVNNELRAQRFYRVYVPEDLVEQPWNALQQVFGKQQWSSHLDVLNEISESVAGMEDIADDTLGSRWTTAAGQKIARLSHRFSGRTSIHANRTLNEPRPPDDPNTPYTFSMEGAHANVPPKALPRYWSPGWNSVNSLTKFQSPVNGPLHGGDPGVRLNLEADIALNEHENSSISSTEGSVLIIPKPFIYGSEELSALSDPVRELIVAPEARLHPETATVHGLEPRDSARLEVGGLEITLPVVIDEQVAKNVVLVPLGYPETAGLTEASEGTIARNL